MDRIFRRANERHNGDDEMKIPCRIFFYMLLTSEKNNYRIHALSFIKKTGSGLEYPYIEIKIKIYTKECVPVSYKK